VSVTSAQVLSLRASVAPSGLAQLTAATMVSTLVFADRPKGKWCAPCHRASGRRLATDAENHRLDCGSYSLADGASGVERLHADVRMKGVATNRHGRDTFKIGGSAIPVKLRRAERDTRLAADIQLVRKRRAAGQSSKALRPPTRADSSRGASIQQIPRALRPLSVAVRFHDFESSTTAHDRLARTRLGLFRQLLYTEAYRICDTICSPLCHQRRRTLGLTI